MPRRVSFRKQTPEERRKTEMLGRVGSWEFSKALRERPTDMKGYPEKKAEEVWQRDGLQFSLVKQESDIPVEMRSEFKHMRFHHYCGYVRFPKRPFREKGYDGIVQYVPVHGGITFAQEDLDGSMVYGFDTNHAGDEGRDDELDNHVWLTHQCHLMGEAIRILRRYERRYKRRSPLGRARLLDDLSRRVLGHLGGPIRPDMNTGVIIRMLTGKP